jgi:hypothetical protein
MEKLQIKKGRIEIVGEDKVPILNLDGFCRDTLAITPGEAIYIKDEIGLGEEVLYSVKDGRLIQVGVESSVPELRDQYEALPKEIECVASA